MSKTATPPAPVTDDKGVAYITLPFAKKARAADGTLTVYGKITGADVDNSGQRMDPTWLATAVPEWFETGANVREMHQLSAVGKALELQREGDDYFVAAKIVDTEAAKKCEEDVYTSFSIGIKKPQLRFGDPLAPNGVYVGGRIIETSVVDRGDLPTARMVVAKAETLDGPLVPNEDVVGKADKKPSEPHAFEASKDDATLCATCGATKDKGMHHKDFGGGQDASKVAISDALKAALVTQFGEEAVEAAIKAQADTGKISDDARDAAGDAGAAIDLGQDHPSYPTRTVGELKDAIKAFGRSSPEDRDKLQAYLIKRAKALGQPDLIPDGWVGKAEGDPAQAHAASASVILKALADLFVQEAEEMASGDDELPSLDALLDCYSALKWWLRTEELEGTPVEGGIIPGSDDGSDIATFAAKPDVTKAGARHSAADQKAIQAAHDATVKAGAVCTTDGEPTEGDGDGTDTGKAETPDVVKVSAELAEAMKLIRSVQSTNEALKAQVEEMGLIAAPTGVRRMAAGQQARKIAAADNLKAEIAETKLRSQGARGAASLGYERRLARLEAELAAITRTE